jgi:hypothetical protein
MKRNVMVCLLAVLIAACSPPLTASGPSKRDATVISEKEFFPNRMFFLDTAYRSFYLGKRATVPDVKPERLQIWLHNAVVAREAAANGSMEKNVYKQFSPYHMTFKLLKAGVDYNLDNRWNGVVRFDSIAIQNDDVVGIHLETDDSAAIPAKGVYWDSRDTSQWIGDTLWTLKFSSQDSLYPTFPLMWRNVYFLPLHIDLASFRVRIVSLPDTTVQRAPDGRLFTEVLGLSDRNGQPYLTNNRIFDVERNLLIIPGFDSSEQGNEPFSNPALGTENATSRTYRETGVDFEKMVPRFRIIYSQDAVE